MTVYDQCNGCWPADSAFAAGRFPCLIKSAQWIKWKEDMTEEEYDLAVEVNKQATSMWQSAEWGMQALQGSFPRITDRFCYEEFGERKQIIEMCLLLYNLRARKVKINQIRNVYLPNLETGVVSRFNTIIH
jgi:hypothetical protein